MNAVLTFSAMGTTGHVEVCGRHSRRLAQQAVGQVAELEQRWSRFIASSDISQLNVSGGAPVLVSSSTLDLLELAVAAWHGTDGKFSPFLQPAMLDIGYHRPMSARKVLKPSVTSVRSTERHYSPLVRSPLHIDRQASTATLDGGSGIDLGGIAKGFSSDLVLADLMSKGADAALVDLGGDMAFASSCGPHPPVSWVVPVDDPFAPGVAIGRLTALRGGVATSSTLRRRWTAADGTEVHHLVDPLTGWSCTTDIAAVTVVADSCASAEVLTKQFVLLGADAAIARAELLGVDALIVGYDRRVLRVGQWEEVNA